MKKTSCEILDDGKLIAVGTKIGEQYHLRCYLNGSSNLMWLKFRCKNPKKTAGIADLDIWENKT